MGQGYIQKLNIRKGLIFSFFFLFFNYVGGDTRVFNLWVGGVIFPFFFLLFFLIFQLWLEIVEGSMDIM